MRFTTLAAALLLPLAALGQDTTSDSTTTSTMTQTKTITVMRVVATSTMTFGNSTTSYMPTGTGASSGTVTVKTTSKIATVPGSTGTSAPISGASNLNAVQYGVAGIAAMVAAAML